MNSIAKRLLATIMLVCVVMSYIAPAAVAAGTSSETVVYDFHLQDDKNMVLDGYFITNYGTDFRLSQILDDVEGFYADGSLNWKYAGASAGLRGTSADEENLPVGVRFSKSYGTRIYSSTGDWLAYTIKSPGTGTYTLSLNYALSYNNGIVATYILPADTQDIIGATDPSNRVGLSNISDSTGVHYNEGNRDANKVYQGFHAYAGNWTFEAGKEYIVVFEVYKGSSFNGKGQMHLFGLEMTPGKVDPSKFDQQTYNDTVGTHLVKENVIPVADAGAMAAVWEVNGQDYYFLPIEGGRLLVFNLDTWELIDSVESGISYPTSTAVLEKEDGTVEVYVGGNGTRMFVYNPHTEESYATPRFDRVSGMEDESAIRGIYAYEDKVYVGLSHGGHLAVYDPKTKTCENLGDMIAEEFSSIEGEEGEVSGDETGGISAITCYGGYLYMTAGSLTQYRLVKFDLSAKKVVMQWDVTSILGACSSSRGLAVLGNGDYLLAGGAGFSGLAMINLSTQKLVTNAEAKALGLSDKALVYGAYGMATEPINGKQYVTTSGGLYEYNHSTKKFSYVGDATNPFVTSGKQCVTLKVDETTKTLSETAPTQLYLFTMAGGGQVRLYNPSESSPIRGKKIGINGLMKEEYGTNGAQVRLNTTGENRDNTKLYLGAFNTPLSAEYNTLTGEITHYRTGGQTDSQIWYDGKLYAGNYSMCVVYEIDMENSDNNTPVIANMINYEQKRIHTLAAGDGHIFAGTIPTTYLNGGGIGIYNTATGEEDFIRFKEKAVNGEKVVSNPELWDLAVKGLAYSGGLLYGATTRAGGSSSQYADGTSAQIFVYDYKNGKILDTLDLREYIPDHLPAGAIDFIGGIVADPVVEGRFWGSVSDVLFTFSYDRSAKTWDVQVVYDYEHEIYNTSGGRASWNLPIVFDEKNNNVYVSLSELGIVRVHLSDWENIGEITTELTLATSPMFMELGADDNLYYGSSADLRMVPVNLTDAEWAQAKAWDAAVLALDANAENLVAEVQALQASYEAMPVRVKMLVQNMVEFQDAEAEVFEKQILEETANVTSDSVETLEALLAQYNGLTDRQKRYVKTYDTLTQAYAQAAQLREAELQQANAVQAQISALNVTSLGDAQAVADARNAYEALNDRQKLLVDTTKLEAAEVLIEELKTVSAVQEKIDNLPQTLSLKDEEAVMAARQAYEALSDVAKANVDITKLVEAEETIENLKDATKTKHIYDFNLYQNEEYIQYLKETLIKSGAPVDMVVGAHNLYKYTYATNITVQSYKWLAKAYPGSLNWAIEGADGVAPGNFGKDYTVTTNYGMQLSFHKPTDATNTKAEFAAVRIDVPSAGTYKVDLSLYQGANSGLTTGDVLNVYIIPAYEDYETSAANITQIQQYLTEDYLAGSLTYTAQANATDTAVYTIDAECAFEKGEHIVVISESTIDTCRYVFLDTLTLTKVIAKVGSQEFHNLEDAFAYQVETGAEHVSLNQDLQLTDLFLQSGQILDLNGHTLIVDSVLSYASCGIVDNSEKDTGVLKILAADGNMLSADNVQLPIYDAEAGGYRFFEVRVNSVTVTGKTDPKYWFKVNFENFEEAYKLIQTGSELNITVKMTWNGGEAEAIASIDYLKQWASAYSRNESIYITVSAVNTEGLGDFTLIPALAANGVFVQGKQM